MLVWSPRAFERTMGTGVEGAGRDYEGFGDGLLEASENGVSGGSGKKENHSEGGKVDLGVSACEPPSGVRER